MSEGRVKKSAATRNTAPQVSQPCPAIAYWIRMFTSGNMPPGFRDDMKFLNAADKEWMLSKTVEQVWPFP
jgi:hypothetical protein